LRARER
jgi:hypothetical protein